KKLIESKGALAFRQLQPVAAKRTPAKPQPPQTEARLTIEAPARTPVPREPETSAPPSAGKKISSLEKLRKQFKDIAPEKEDKPLEEATLLEAWQQFTQHLRDTRNPAAQSFALATVKITDAHSFYVYTSNPLENRFVEITKNEAAEFLKTALQNAQLQIFNEINPNRQPTEEEIIEKPLSVTEQYQKMIAKYPLIGQLKEKLKLELVR